MTRVLRADKIKVQEYACDTIIGLIFYPNIKQDKFVEFEKKQQQQK